MGCGGSKGEYDDILGPEGKRSTLGDVTHIRVCQRFGALYEAEAAATAALMEDDCKSEDGYSSVGPRAAKATEVDLSDLDLAAPRYTNLVCEELDGVKASLKMLSLCRCGLQGDALVRIAREAAKCRNLVAFRFDGNELDEVAASQVARALTDSSVLAKSALRDISGIALCEHLAILGLEGDASASGASNADVLLQLRDQHRRDRLSSRVLTRSGDRITDKIRKKFMGGVNGKVNLNFIAFDVERHVPVLCEELLIMGVDIEELWLRACGLGDAGLAATLDQLAKCPNMRNMILSENKITDEGLEILGQKLHLFPRLESVELTGNKYTSRGEAAFAAALAGGPPPPRVKELGGITLKHYLRELGLTREYVNAKNEQIFALLNGARLIQGQEIAAAPNRGPVDRLTAKFATAAGSGENRGIVNLNFMVLKDHVLLKALCKEICGIGGGLSEIWLRGCGLDDAAAIRIADALKACPNLKKVILAENQISNRGARFIADELYRCEQMQLLHLTNNRLSEDGLVALAENLHRYPRLQELNVEGNGFGPEAERSFAVAVSTGPAPPKMPQLAGVRLNRFVRDMGIPAGLGESSNADILDFLNDWRNQERDPVAEIQAKFSSISRTGRLNLNFCRLDDDASRACVVECFGEHAASIEEVWLRGCVLGDAGAAMVLPALEACTGLRGIVLSENRLTDAGVTSLGTSLAAWSQLETIDLASNGVGDVGAGALGGRLHLCPRLKHLYFNENDAITPNGVRDFAVALAEALETPRIQDLRGMRLNRYVAEMKLPLALQDASNGEVLAALNDGVHRKKARGPAERVQRKFGKSDDLNGLVNLNFINFGSDPEAMQVFGEELRRRSGSVRELWLRGAGLDDSSAAAFADQLDACVNLRQIILTENRIGNTGLGAVGQHLHHCPALRSLDLSGNPFNDDGVRAFAAALRANPAPALRDLKGLELAPHRDVLGLEGDSDLARAANSVILSRLSDADGSGSSRT